MYIIEILKIGKVFDLYFFKWIPSFTQHSPRTWFYDIRSSKCIECSFVVYYMLCIGNSFWCTQNGASQSVGKSSIVCVFCCFISSLSFSIHTGHAGDHQLLQFLPTYMLSVLWLMTVGMKWYSLQFSFSCLWCIYWSFICFLLLSVYLNLLLS